jgi:hypothetical protein
MRTIRLILILAGIVLFQISYSQDDASEKENLSKDLANPIANLMSFPFQNNTNFGMGPHDRAQNILNIQPVLPFFKGKVITRTILPIVWIPDYYAETGLYASGIGDLLFTAWYTPGIGGFIWGVGPAVEFPTGGEKKGSQKWSAGPSIVGLVQPGSWTFGLLANNLWSFTGDEDRNEVNKGLINLFIVRQMGKGWYLNSAPIITVNWMAEKGQQWIVPLGVGGGKLVYLGKLPINIQSQAYYNVVQPDLIFFRSVN